MEIPFVANGAGRHALETVGMKSRNDRQLRLMARDIVQARFVAQEDLCVSRKSRSSSRGNRPANPNSMQREHRYGAKLDLRRNEDPQTEPKHKAPTAVADDDDRR
ncbi:MULTISPECIES: hypothetical protein [unclassified Rhizobium]|uniref:hypothetical protein n=1 Tax=unclassified Rhizobium TaxID=2613769 RepID=UPI001ADD05A8|nr:MULTISPECIES: hypothetical protein [unclassified Rhizobium]MBO9126401.1 hypothetical protein [Rhizobium sp. 16-488-2b]MBO9178336.1 hypothetical protein [Rhizobium sp. 16-488-2a]